MRIRFENHDLETEGCGQFVEIPSCEVEDWARGVAERRGFSAEHHQADIFGLCPTCRERARPPSRDRSPRRS